MVKLFSACSIRIRNIPDYTPRIFFRHKSLTAAIERGKQSTGGFGYDTDRPRRAVSPARPSRGFDRPRSITWEGRSSRDFDRPGREWRERPRADDGHGAKPSLRQVGTPRGTYKERTEKDRTAEDAKIESLPYTTAASEFIYGQSSVHAAIKANRRRLYKLYVHKRGLNSVGLLERARAHRLNIQAVGDEYLPAMDKASSGRPHNGFILEASPLRLPPVTDLLSFSIKQGNFTVTRDKQSTEDALVNGTDTEFTYKSAGWRHPLVLYVDGVLDEGNLGAIARSAYFLGVDAIATPTRQSAPWSHIAVKASAGAAEALTLFSVNQPADFLGSSARQGWRIYASDALPPKYLPAISSVATPAAHSTENFESDIIYTYARSSRRLPEDHCPVDSHPTILMMGAEGTGLRNSLLNLAHYKVGIRHGRDVDEVGVDSLNVSVAASLLCQHMLRKPKPKPVRRNEDLLF